MVSVMKSVVYGNSKLYAVHVLSAMMCVHASGNVVGKAIVCKYGIMQMSKAPESALGIPNKACGRTNG